jgi:hypothetical protein
MDRGQEIALYPERDLFVLRRGSHGRALFTFPDNGTKKGVKGKKVNKKAKTQLAVLCCTII